MKKQFIALLLSLACAAILSAADSDGFVPLYNGKDLTGWRSVGGTIESWKANGEVLECHGGGGAGWLTYEKEYSDFILKLDWKISKDGNSGVGIRYPATGKASASAEGMEIQILDDNAPKHKDIKPAQHTGSIYTLVAPKEKATKPVGEWNSYIIECKGPHITITLNGVEVVNVDADKETTAEDKHTPLSARPRKGFVALQNHGTKCEFKNLLIKDLSSTSASKADDAGAAINRALGGIGK